MRLDNDVDSAPRLSGITVAEQGRWESGRFGMLALVGMPTQRGRADAARTMVGLMIPRVQIRHVALAFFFALCQVIGATCALSDLSMAADTALLVEEGMVCPMDGTTMCPPSLTTSSQRQIKHSMVSDIDPAPILLSVSVALTDPSVPALWSWSSALSLVPTSMGSSSVLRI